MRESNANLARGRASRLEKRLLATRLRRSHRPFPKKIVEVEGGKNRVETKEELQSGPLAVNMRVWVGQEEDLRMGMTGV